MSAPLFYEFPVDPVGFIEVLIEDTDREMAADLGGCGWYLRQQGVEGYEDATCSFGCYDEPSCETCEPTGGWPSSHPDYDYRKAWAERFTNDLLANAVVHVDLGVSR